MRSITTALLGVFSATLIHADDWPQWMGPERDGVWRESGIVARLPEGGPPERWRTAIGAGYAGPAVVGNRVYVADRILKTNANNPDDPFARAGEIPGWERVLCLDEATGELIWKYENDVAYTVSYASGPRATPTVVDGRIYALGAEGHLTCLNADTGAVVWQVHFAAAFGARTPLWGYAASPLVHGDAVVCLVGGEGAGVVAFHKDTGERLWGNLSPEEPGYCPPRLLNWNGQERLLIWNPEGLYALDPESGATQWEYPWEIRFGLSIPLPRVVDNQIFLTAFYNGSALLELAEDGSGVTEVWKSPKVSEKDTTFLHSIMSTPVIDDGHIYGCCSYGQFRCLNLENGERLWETLEITTGGREARWGNAFITHHEDRYFLFNERGELLIATLSPEGYDIVSKASLLEPNSGDLRQRQVVWSHPAYANQSIYARNDTEIVAYSLAAD